MSCFEVEHCDECGKESRRPAPRAFETVIFDSGMASWMRLQLGNREIRSLCSDCAMQVRQLLPKTFPLELPESDADRGPVQ